MTVLPHRGDVHPPPARTLLLGHRSYGLIRQSQMALLSFGLGLVQEVFAGCYQSLLPVWDFPDAISANLSPDAWSLATAVPRSALACFFLRVIGLPQQRNGSASRYYPRTRLLAEAFFEAADISLCSSLRVCSPPRSFLPLRDTDTGQPRLLHPGIPCFVASARTGYASRPNTGN
jgi:hypothetical protein